MSKVPESNIFIRSTWGPVRLDQFLRESRRLLRWIGNRVRSLRELTVQPVKTARLTANVSIVRRRKGARGFKLQPRRWVVERTFGWLTRWRRLNRNYEHTPESSRAVVQVALIGIMARRLARTHK